MTEAARLEECRDDLAESVADLAVYSEKTALLPALSS